MEFLEAMDQGAVPWFRYMRVPWLDPFMIWVTALGGQPVLLVVVLMALVGLVAGRCYRSAAVLAGVAVAAQLLDLGVKWLVARPRPEVPHPLSSLPESWSFPSGHALNATTIYPTVALLATAGSSRGWVRWLAVGGAGLTAFLIGVSRLYLGHHYVTDVLGGWAAGVGLVLVGWRLAHKGYAVGSGR